MEVIRIGRRRSSGRLNGSFRDGTALSKELLGEFDDENRVLRRETDEHDETDLDVDVVDQAAERDERERSQDCHRDSEKDDERQREGLVLSRQGEVDDQKAEAKDDDGLAFGLHFFECETGPRVGHALEFVLLEELDHGCVALTGAKAWCGRTVDLGRAEEVVVVDDLGSGDLLDTGEVVERDHLAGVGTDVELTQVLRVTAELLVCLDVDAVGAVVVVEVVDVAGAHEGSERSGDLAEGNANGFGFLPIDGDLELRIVRRELGVHGSEARAWSAALCDEGMGDASDVIERVSTAVLKNELEAADSSEAGDGGWFRCEGDTARDTEELWPYVADDVSCSEFVTHLCAVVNGLERRKDESGVWRAAAGEGEAHDREGAEDAIVFPNYIRDAIGEFGGVS